MNITECRITRHAVQCTPVCSVLHGITTDTKPPVLIWLCNNPWINLSVWVTSYVSIVGEGVMSEWWGAGVVICLEWGADLYMAQPMPLPLTVSCFSKIQIGFTFLVPAHPGSPGKRAVKWVCVCVERVCAVYKVCNTKPFQYCYVTSTMMYWSFLQLT